MSERIRVHTELEVYGLAFEAAMVIFERSRQFPKEEIYSLTDQVRRSSRPVCANIAEVWRKRRYPADFVSKLSHAEAEAAKTQVWLQFAVSCGYLDREQAQTLSETYDRILAKLVIIINHPNQWTLPR